VGHPRIEKAERNQDHQYERVHRASIRGVENTTFFDREMSGYAMGH
jgi:hypothetical protein